MVRLTSILGLLCTNTLFSTYFLKEVRARWLC